MLYFGCSFDLVLRLLLALLYYNLLQFDILVPTITTLLVLLLRRRRTFYEHQLLAIEFLGMIRFEATDMPTFLEPLTEVVRAGVTGDHLLSAARKLIYERRFVIPGPRRVLALAQQAVVKVERHALAIIEADIPPDIRQIWIEALYRPAAERHRMTLLDYIQEPPGKFSPSTIERQHNKIDRLLHLKVAK